MLLFCVIVMALHSERSRVKARWVVSFVRGEVLDKVMHGAEFIEGCGLCRSAVQSFVTRHRKLSMFSSELL